MQRCVSVWQPCSLAVSRSSVGLCCVLLSIPVLPAAPCNPQLRDLAVTTAPSPRTLALRDAPQGLTGPQAFVKELFQHSFGVSQGLWQRGQLATSWQYDISKRYANASWNANVTFHLFHTINSQLNLWSGNNRDFLLSSCKWTPTCLWIQKQHGFGSTATPALLWAQAAGTCPASAPCDVCLSLHLFKHAAQHSQRHRRSGQHPGMARGYGHSSETKQTLGRPCNSKTITKKRIFPSKGV